MLDGLLPILAASHDDRLVRLAVGELVVLTSVHPRAWKEQDRVARRARIDQRFTRFQSSLDSTKRRSSENEAHPLSQAPVRLTITLFKLAQIGMLSCERETLFPGRANCCNMLIHELPTLVRVHGGKGPR
jgi:hypothetical protein